MKRHGFPALCLALALALAQAASPPPAGAANAANGSFNRQTVRPSGFGEAGTRPLGMGEAYVAVSDDAAGTFWNPAGLAFMPEEKRYVDVMIKANEREEATYDSIALAGPVYTETKKAEFSIQEYLESNLKAPVYGRRLNYNYGVGGIFIDQYGGTGIQNYFFSVGKKLDNVKGLAIGTKVRLSAYSDYMNDQNAAEDFLETSIGCGAVYELNKYLRAGLMIDNSQEFEVQPPAGRHLGVAISSARDGSRSTASTSSTTRTSSAAPSSGPASRRSSSTTPSPFAWARRTAT
jgi:hypothetical protein